MQSGLTTEIENIIREAQKIGVKNNVKYVGTEQIIYGMLATPSNYAQMVLNSYGLLKENFLPHLKQTFQPLDTTMGYTPNTKSVIQLAISISKESKVNFVSAEHMLLAILKTRECKASQIFRNMGLDVSGMVKVLEARINSMASTQNVDSQSENIKNKHGYESPKELEELEDIGYDLTLKAYNGNLDPVIGRDTEIHEIIKSLARKTKNSPVLVGEPGVGKSAIVEGLATEIVMGRVPDILLGKTIFSLDLASILSGSKYRGEFEEKFKKIIDIVQRNEIIVFIDEIHNLMGAGKSEGSMDASEMLKPMLARGGFHLIGATTYDEYAKYIEKDEALTRRLQPVFVKAPSIEDSIKILNGIKDKYEAFHRVEIKEDAIKEAVILSDRYINDRQLPDKAIDLIDECASQARLQACAPEKEIYEIKRKVEKLETDIKHGLNVGEKTKIKKLMSEREMLLSEIEKIESRRLANLSGKRPFIDGQDIAKIVSLRTKIPVAKLTREEADRLLSLERELHTKVIGQEQAVQVVTKALKRARVGLNDAGRPLGSFIFVGPTGVGKTELSKALAEIMFGDERLLIRIDMGEYMQKEDLSKLIGAPPGYVGYDEEGYLTQRVRREPYSVVLFDEVEKAHPDIFNVLLQVLDEGRLTDNKGRTVDFKNTIIIMTSNAGITSEVMSAEQEKENITRALKQNFRPEFLNRVDEIVHFHRLTYAECSQIVIKFLSKLEKTLASKGIGVVFDKSCIDCVLRKGYSLEYGARPLRDVIRNTIIDMISDRLIAADIKSGDNIRIYAVNNEIDFEIL